MNKVISWIFRSINSAIHKCFHSFALLTSLNTQNYGKDCANNCDFLSALCHFWWYYDENQRLQVHGFGKVCCARLQMLRQVVQQKLHDNEFRLQYNASFENGQSELVGGEDFDRINNDFRPISICGTENSRPTTVQSSTVHWRSATFSMDLTFTFWLNGLSTYTLSRLRAWSTRVRFRGNSKHTTSPPTPSSLCRCFSKENTVRPSGSSMSLMITFSRWSHCLSWPIWATSSLTK